MVNLTNQNNFKCQQSFNKARAYEEKGQSKSRNSPITITMLGEKGMELIKEAARNREGNMGPFNEDKVNWQIDLLTLITHAHFL